MTNGEALAGQGEGLEPNPNTYEEGTIMTIISDSPDIRTAITKWVTDRLDRRERVLTEIRRNELFQAWAAGEIATGPWDMRDCERVALRDRSEDLSPEWPSIATPWWASAEVGEENGGEVMITFERRIGSVLVAGDLTVIVDDDPRNDRNHPGHRLGDYFSSSEAVRITINGEHEDLDLAGASELFDSLAQGVTLLREIEAVH